jgi:UDP-N-acetylglucosamine--N-acetylmuramyl-(pentapeptide) pyrophosphoryl-undecaprenol N-acetylglucosamine transferase
VKVIFAGGGTGGHVFPAIAIADEVKKLDPSAEILFVGTKEKIESRLVPQKGYVFRTIWISGFRRKLSPDNLLFPLKVLISLLQSLLLLKSEKPDVVVGTGGYVSGPVLYVASLLGIPTVVQEQNSLPGVTTRLLSRRATEVHLMFESAVRYLKRSDNIRITGNPTREILGSISRTAALEHFGFLGSKKTLLVLGGSLGARSINNAIVHCLKELGNAGIQIIWQTGDLDFERVRSLTGEYPDVKVYKFIESMEYAYAAADLALCRAGAITIAELTRLGVPTVFIPYPYAAANHQVENAKVIVNAKAAEMIMDHEADRKTCEVVLGLIHDDGRLQAMHENSLMLGKPAAAKEIAQLVITLGYQ